MVQKEIEKQPKCGMPHSNVMIEQRTSQALSNPAFFSCYNQSEEESWPKTSPIQVLQRCCLTHWVTPALLCLSSILMYVLYWQPLWTLYCPCHLIPDTNLASVSVVDSVTNVIRFKWLCYTALLTLLPTILFKASRTEVDIHGVPEHWTDECFLHTIAKAIAW